MPPQRDRWFAFNSCIDRDTDRTGVVPGFPVQGESSFFFSFYQVQRQSSSVPIYYTDFHLGKVPIGSLCFSPLGLFRQLKYRYGR